jgi:ribose transport system substrate-binding protein
MTKSTAAVSQRIWARASNEITRYLTIACAVLALDYASITGVQAQDRKYTIALIPGTTTDAFYITMHRGAEAAATALGVELLYQGPSDSTVVKQAPVVDAVIARKPDAILIAPDDKVQLIQPLKRAVDLGIAVITVDTFIGTGQYQTGTGDADFPLSYIASDNVLGGRIAARALAKAIGDKGKVYISNVVPGVSTNDQREEGFRDEMKKHPGITVLDTQYNDDDANKAASQLRSVCARNPDLAGVFGANIFSAIGTANGVQQAGLTGKVKVAAFDAPASIVDNIKTGLVDIAIAQHPAEIGYFGVVVAYAHLTGQSVPTLIGTGFTIMDKSNIDQPEVARFIYKE